MQARFLMQIGGINPAKCVNSMLKAIMSTSVAAELSLVGRGHGGKSKLAFNKLAFYSIITGKYFHSKT
jgi:hypothetical protein